MNITLNDIEAAAWRVYRHMPPTPQYQWPLLTEQLGAELWVKHENHTPVGAFKIRGGINYFHHLSLASEKPEGVVSATRGNHGQSVGYASRCLGLPCTIIVPHGNSVEKNSAMLAQGVTLIEHGDDFQESREFAQSLAAKNNWHMVPSFHDHLVAGVATYCLELLQDVADIDVVYVPVGMGSGICGMIAARDALGLDTKIIGVSSEHAPAYAESFAAGKSVSAPAETELADGMACRVPDAAALQVILEGADSFSTVSDEQVSEAMRDIYRHTHNVAEGAGAAAFAAAMSDQHKLAGKRVAIVLSGGNVDKAVFAEVLNQ